MKHSRGVEKYLIGKLSFGLGGVDDGLLETLCLLWFLELQLYLLFGGRLFSLWIQVGKLHHCQLDAVLSVHQFLHLGVWQEACSVDYYFGYFTLQSEIQQLQVAFDHLFQEKKHVLPDCSHPSLEFYELELPQFFSCAFRAGLFGLLIWLILSYLFFLASLHLLIVCCRFRRNNGKRHFVLKQPAQVQRCLVECEKIDGLLTLKDVDSRFREGVWLNYIVLLLYDCLLINIKQDVTLLHFFELSLCEQLILLTLTQVYLLEPFTLPLRFFLHMWRVTSAEAWRSRMHGNYCALIIIITLLTHFKGIKQSNSKMKAFLIFKKSDLYKDSRQFSQEKGLALPLADTRDPQRLEGCLL